MAVLTLAAAFVLFRSHLFKPRIHATENVISVAVTEFAGIPDAEDGEAPRLMHLVDEPGTKRLFVSTMRGMLYSVSYDGQQVTPYLDVNAATWAIGVQSSGSERGLQSFTFHPQFAQEGKPGYGRFYTYTDTTNISVQADFSSGAPTRMHDTVLLEWMAKDPLARTYDGGHPRELFRFAQPFPNHNGGQISFNPLATEASEDFGLLYVGAADGGAGGDPMNLAQNRSSAFGKILRIDPLGSNSANGHYGIPASNPFVGSGQRSVLGEIYALGVRNPQRFTWDAKNGQMYVADIGQARAEEISPVSAGANLGWNQWEGSTQYVDLDVDVPNPVSKSELTWPVAEYRHDDPLLQRFVAITGIAVYRDHVIPQFTDLMLFGDNPSGELFYTTAERSPNVGAGVIGRILLDDGTGQKTLMQLIHEKNALQGRPPAARADLRFGFGLQGQVFLMNKQDGVIRQVSAQAPVAAGTAP